jgi:hypothetical protein
LQPESTTPTNELSIYQGHKAEPKDIAMELSKLQVAFTDISKEYMSVLTERLVRNGFTKERLRDAIGHVIDNFNYRRPNISDIISFDKKVKMYTYAEVFRMIEKGEASGFEDFQIVEVNGNKFRVKKTDVQFFRTSS